MSRLIALYRSSVGKKVIVSVTGAMLLGFLVLHVAGNLKAFLGDAQPGLPEIDVYARFLRTMGGPLLPYSSVLWGVRILLLLALVLHVVCVAQLIARNWRARPVRYEHPRYVQASVPARWMAGTGILVLTFLGMHILQFTTGSIDASRFVDGAVYANLHRTFSLWPWVAIYVVAMVVLALHLYHGAWSLFQSLGLDNPDRNRALRTLAVVASAGLFLAFASVPIAFFTGALAPPAAATPPNGPD